MGNDDAIRKNLTISRMYVAMSYLNSPFLQLLIEQLEQVSGAVVSLDRFLLVLGLSEFKVACPSCGDGIRAEHDLLQSFQCSFLCQTVT